eukprot:jgi/Tetstr1/465762/TSEL_010387.t1
MHQQLGAAYKGKTSAEHLLGDDSAALAEFLELETMLNCSAMAFSEEATGMSEGNLRYNKGGGVHHSNRGITQLHDDLAAGLELRDESQIMAITLELGILRATITAALEAQSDSTYKQDLLNPQSASRPSLDKARRSRLARRRATGDAHSRVHHDAIADAFRDHCVHDMGIAVRREVDDLFQQAMPLGNTVPRDGLKDLVPDADLSLPAFNVVTGSYDPRSLKSTLLEFKTMRYGVKYTAVPRATVVDRFERSMLGDIQRGLAVWDATWHNTEPGQKGPSRDILDMSEYTGKLWSSAQWAW